MLAKLPSIPSTYRSVVRQDLSYALDSEPRLIREWIEIVSLRTGATMKISGRDDGYRVRMCHPNAAPFEFEKMPEKQVTALVSDWIQAQEEL